MTPEEGTSDPRGWPVERATSYGGVLVRAEDGEPEVALIRPRGKDVWALPKGASEPGEEPEQAALREVAEETGMGAEIVEALDPITYWFTWTPERVRYRKTVHFFLMRATDARGGHDDEVDEVRFFPLAEAVQRASYASERKVIEQAARHLSAR
jgi:8-oxo-dGTP pyrophosphatase MutT (NUDIX family)